MAHSGLSLHHDLAWAHSFPCQLTYPILASPRSARIPTVYMAQLVKQLELIALESPASAAIVAAAPAAAAVAALG